ncbi:MAG: AMP-binding protein [Pseudomonadales bacterium]|jgi:long-chain acyl-CoA synthetase|nr:AMP-binding protein [Pseudomonadales bacterium]MDP6470404.1 AMP-binding protein [Pseudomonadales bacterium]MDP6827704.1 AMP-binding protein [Pseudomonadales bacterium]MDP6973349.1 AMP-binding protein [Pseudomonadales bacterium]
MDTEALERAIATGMTVAFHAARQPDTSAVVTRYGDRTFAQLNANANRLARLLRRHGLGDGDSMAVVARNRPEFIEALVAACRTGIRFTPINFHLKGEEIGYIVDNCDAKVFIADATLAPSPIEAVESAPNLELRLAAGGHMPEFEDYDTSIEQEDGSDIEDPVFGSRMLYTSGTTGRPKGVSRRERIPQAPVWGEAPGAYLPGDRDLVTGPGYHAAPLLIDIIQPLTSGAGIVMMDKWDAQETLRLIEEYRITHTHMVATMFHRLLSLPEAVRSRYDLSSMRHIVHGAAPCPVHVKQAMIDWFGPIIWEYYAATEGGGGFLVGSEEWLTKPGTVGKPGPDFDNKILDDDGNEVAANEVGTIYMRAPEKGRFEYYKDEDKTSSSYRGDYFTLGDMGFFDDDGYLFLTGRSAELIISGGVNIYPQEVDGEIMKHPAVHDVCTIGVPNDEWGEEVKSVVALSGGFEPSDQLSDELIAWARERLASFKCPRSIGYAQELPRSEAGKIQRRVVRAPYWED